MNNNKNACSVGNTRPKSHVQAKVGMRQTLFVLLLLEVASATAANAPLPIEVPPNLGRFTNGLSATQIIVSGSVRTSAVGPNLELLTAGDGYVETLRDYHCITGPVLECEAGTTANAKSASAGINGYTAEASSTGSATSGTLRASSSVHVTRPDTRGAPVASATTTVTFTDVIFFGDNGEIAGSTLAFEPTLNVQAGFNYDPEIPSGAGYRAFLWMFPYDPSRSFLLDAQFGSATGEMFFRSQEDQARGAFNTIQIGSLNEVQPNSAYWIHGVLETSAGANLSNFFFGAERDSKASANLSHTVHFYLDPASSNPNATYTTASGASFLSPTVVPLPGGLMLLGSSLVATLATVVRLRTGQRHTRHTGL